jgi:excisionase family DNA binding protein
MNEVSEQLRVSLATVKRLVKTGELGSMKVAGQRRISRYDLNRYFRAARRGEQQAGLREDGDEGAAFDATSQRVLALLDAVCVLCEGGKLVVSRPSGRYAEVPIVPPATGMPLERADIARILVLALEQLGPVPVPPAKNGHDPRQRELELPEPETEVEIEDVLDAAFGEEDPAARPHEAPAETFDPFPERL